MIVTPVPPMGGMGEAVVISDFRFGYGTFTHPSSRHALICAGSA